MKTDITIVSNGTAAGTKVLLPNGEQLKAFITKIEWSIEGGGGTHAEAVITFGRVNIDVAAEVDLPEPATA